jgi:hypothetical protein
LLVFSKKIGAEAPMPDYIGIYAKLLLATS